MAQYRKKNQQTILEIIVVGIFKGIWFLLTLPFRGIKFGRGKSGLSVEERNYVTGKRLEIEKMLDSKNEIELKHAVIEADKLVDYTLKTKGYAGETFADRLRNAQDSINPSVYNSIWQGHKVRNEIAHEQELRIKNSELREATTKLINYLKNI